MRRWITGLFAPADPGRAGLVLLLLAALAIAVAGTYHGRLYHQGYAEVSVVGPLFVLNVFGSAAAVLLLLLRRVRLFALAALTISIGALVSILSSHTWGFFGFSEQGYSTSAQVIVTAEIAAVVLTFAGLVAGRGQTRQRRGVAAGARSRSDPPTVPGFHRGAR